MSWWVRVHNLVSQSVWSKRYDLISDFEKMLSANGTHVLKFYLHISPEEQLARFRGGSTTRRETGRSAKATTPNARSGRNTWKPTKTP
jgi:polyphosphate kinase 2 (PPK2 family)